MIVCSHSVGWPVASWCRAASIIAVGPSQPSDHSAWQTTHLAMHPNTPEDFLLIR